MINTWRCTHMNSTLTISTLQELALLALGCSRAVARGGTRCRAEQRGEQRTDLVQGTHLVPGPEARRTPSPAAPVRPAAAAPWARRKGPPLGGACPAAGTAPRCRGAPPGRPSPAAPAEGRCRRPRHGCCRRRCHGGSSCCCRRCCCYSRRCCRRRPRPPCSPPRGCRAARAARSGGPPSPPLPRAPPGPGRRPPRGCCGPGTLPFGC